MNRTYSCCQSATNTTFSSP